MRGAAESDAADFKTTAEAEAKTAYENRLKELEEAFDAEGLAETFETAEDAALAVFQSVFETETGNFVSYITKIETQLADSVASGRNVFDTANTITYGISTFAADAGTQGDDGQGPSDTRKDTIGDWDVLIDLAKDSPVTTEMLTKIKRIAYNTVNSFISFRNTQIEAPRENVIRPEEGRGYCVAWVNNVWNQVSALPEWEKKDGALMYFSDDGYIIALKPEVLDYNGWSLYASHAVMRIEVGKGYNLDDYRYKGNVGFVSKALLGVAYLDNNLFGGRDRIFDISTEGKSLLPYPGYFDHLILDQDVKTPSSYVRKQTQWFNWF